MDTQGLGATTRGTPSKQRSKPTVAAVFDNGTIIEPIYRPQAKRTAFAVWRGGSWRIESAYTPERGPRLAPYSANNNLIRNNVVLLPSEPLEYGTEEDLIDAIQRFTHRYVDVTPRFERIASCYVLFSWIYDSFNELPYLRLRGDYGSGKTRFLLTVGALCYKPIFASGASTVSPIFHTLDAFRGTLIIDEGDFRYSDEKADIVKILNNGNVKGLPVLRTEVSPKGEFNPRAFNVFGPKLVATRGFYDDRALESRFITEEMGGQRLRADIPINLPASYEEEALTLRNKLLLYRLRNVGAKRTAPGLVDAELEPRLNQIFVPLMSAVQSGRLRSELHDLARQYNRELVMDRGMDIEAQVLEVIRELLAQPETTRLAIKDIAGAFTKKFGDEYERLITNKWIGAIVRRKLQLKTQKSHGVFVVPPSELSKLERLYERYGVGFDEADTPDVTQGAGEGSVDVGDVGDVARRPAPG